jgi:deoxyribodipyrimidine photolyase
MQKVIHWFRQDLRLNDNPALFDAASCSNSKYTLEAFNQREQFQI